MFTTLTLLAGGHRTSSCFGDTTLQLLHIYYLHVVVDRSSASAWRPNAGSCAYSANILLRPNVKIILRPNLRLRPFSATIISFGRRWFSSIYI